MSKWILIAGALLGALAVMSGAFGAHALQDVLTPKTRNWYETAVTYHMNHALALLVCGLLAQLIGKDPGRGWLQTAGVCYIAGIVVFSGSLYAMALTGMTRLGMITPVGGVLLIIAWLCLGVAGSRLVRSSGV